MRGCDNGSVIMGESVMMGESVTGRECKMGECTMVLELGRSPRGFTAARLTLPSGTEFEQPNHFGGEHPMPR